MISYDYDVTGNVTAIRENGAMSGAGVLATYGYDDLGRRVKLVRGNRAQTIYAFDPASRLSSLTQDMVGGTSRDLTVSATSYDPAGRLVSQTRSNDAYAWGGHYNVDRAYARPPSSGPPPVAAAGARTRLTPP